MSAGEDPAVKEEEGKKPEESAGKEPEEEPEEEPAAGEEEPVFPFFVSV